MEGEFYHKIKLICIDVLRLICINKGNRGIDVRTNFAFQGHWRSYQQRVLDKYDRYSQDRKIHIVAAPGSENNFGN
ncbi:MAG: hypothetical protein ACLRQF_05665 [Thomasclavelia ramosa]